MMDTIKPWSKEELASLKEEYEQFKEEFAKADSIAWKAVAEAMALSQRELLIVISNDGKQEILSSDVMPLAKAAGEELGFADQYVFQTEPSGEEVTLRFEKIIEGKWRMYRSHTDRRITVTFYAGAEPVLTVDARAYPIELGDVTPSNISRIEISFSDEE